MSKEVNIQIQLSTVLSAIKSGDGEILADVINNLLLADYEIFKQIRELGHQVAKVNTELDLLKEEINEELELEDVLDDIISFDEDEDVEDSADKTE